MEKSQLKVLVVEDDRTSRAMAMACLSNNDDVFCKKFHAENATAGIEKFIKENPDITFLDIGLPDVSGLVALERMIEHNPRAFIVMMTASSREKDVNQAKASGAMGYILKPFNNKRFQDVLSSYFAYQKYLAHFDKNDMEKIDKRVKEASFLMEEEQVEESGEPLNCNILFVDGMDSNCIKAENALEAVCATNTANNIEGMINRIKDKTFQVIMLDMQLKGQNIRDVVKNIRTIDKEHQHYSYIIAMLASESEAANNKWKEMGADNYIVKPCHFGEVKKMVKALVEDNALSGKN